MFEVADRYDVMGPPNGCDGPCDGTGVVPVPPPAPRHLADVWCEDAAWTSDDDESVALREAWRAAEAAHESDDGWHFVPCPRCTVEGS